MAQRYPDPGRRHPGKRELLEEAGVHLRLVRQPDPEHDAADGCYSHFCRVDAGPGPAYLPPPRVGRDYGAQLCDEGDHLETSAQSSRSRTR